MQNLQEKINNIAKTFFPRFGIGKEVDYFVENLASLLSAGIPVLNALDSMSMEIRSLKLKKIIKQIAKDVEDGVSLSSALENSRLFSANITILLRMGEQSGRLVENLKIIAIQEQKKRVLNSKIRSAAMYPVFVLSLTLFVGIGIAWFILPKLATVFSQLKVQLPTITKMLIGFGQFLNNYGGVAIPIFILLFISIIFFFFFFPKTKFLGEYFLFILPGAKTLLKQVEITRFSYVLGTLLSAGISPTEALNSIAHATSFRRYRDMYLFLASSINEGNSFKKSFLLYKNINKLIPPSVQQLIVAGEQSGSLSLTLGKISETYELKTDTTAKDLTVMLEPVLLVIVWLGVVAVAMAVILPIYSLVGQLNS
ncbi:MAG: type II secretion system F family protein [Patescibacteria group bacterium]